MHPGFPTPIFLQASKILKPCHSEVYFLKKESLRGTHSKLAEKEKTSKKFPINLYILGVVRQKTINQHHKYSILVENELKS